MLFNKNSHNVYIMLVMSKVNNCPLVSIIIPTYNRAHLIGETLDSVLAQTYTKWECIIIDDGSTDSTDHLINQYAQKDQRFRYFKRPSNKQKGANACRNIGLQHSKGEYVVYFDSDDLMTIDHLETKINAVKARLFDYAVTKTQFFNSDSDNKLLERNYTFNSQDINAYNYISQKINWLTCDICIKSSLAKSIEFNEHLKAGQEYNYFSKLTLKSTNAVFFKKIVTLRRQHDDSIRGKLKGDKISGTHSYIQTYWHTYLDTKKDASLKIRQFLIYRCYRLSRKLPIEKRLYGKDIDKALIKEFGLKGCFYVVQLQLKKWI